MARYKPTRKIGAWTNKNNQSVRQYVTVDGNRVKKTTVRKSSNGTITKRSQYGFLGKFKTPNKK